MSVAAERRTWRFGASALLGLSAALALGGVLASCSEEPLGPPRQGGGAGSSSGVSDGSSSAGSRSLARIWTLTIPPGSTIA